MTPAPSASAGRFAAVAVIAAILAVGAALYERSMARAARAAMVADARAYAEAQREARAPRNPAAGKNAPVSAAAEEAGPDEAVARRPANPAAARPGSSPAEMKDEFRRFLGLHPEVRDILDAYAKREFAYEFGAFFKSAGLTGAQADQVESLIFDKWFGSLGIGPQGNIRSGAGDLVPAAEQLRGVLGDQGAQLFQDYARTMPAQGIAGQIAAKAGLASAPMTPDQAAQVAQVMAGNSPDYAAGRAVSLPTVDWDATLTQLGAFLSPAQAQAAQRQIVALQYQYALAQARQAAGGPR